MVYWIYGFTEIVLSHNVLTTKISILQDFPSISDIWFHSNSFTREIQSDHFLLCRAVIYHYVKAVYISPFLQKCFRGFIIREYVLLANILV